MLGSFLKLHFGRPTSSRPEQRITARRFLAATLVASAGLTLVSCSLLESGAEVLGVLAAGNTDPGTFLVSIGAARVEAGTPRYPGQRHLGFASDAAAGALFWSRAQSGSTNWIVERLDRELLARARLLSETLSVRPWAPGTLVLVWPLVVAKGGGLVASSARIINGGAGRDAVISLNARTLAVHGVFDGLRLLSADPHRLDCVLVARSPSAASSANHVFRLNLRLGVMDSFSISPSLFLAAGPLPETFYVRGAGYVVLVGAEGQQIAASVRLPFIGPPSVDGPVFLSIEDSVLILGDQGTFDAEGTGAIEVLDAITLGHRRSLVVFARQGVGGSVRVLGYERRSGHVVVATTTNGLDGWSDGHVLVFRAGASEPVYSQPVDGPFQGAFW